MKKSVYFQSFIYPVTVELTSSTFNKVLEVVLSAGHYSLNSENTNYSFGSLHILFKKVFRRLKLNWNVINDVLILGFGTGSVSQIINKYKSDCKIDGVEIDKKVIELGEKYFNTLSLENTVIHCDAADTFVKECSHKYDLIIIDVYNDVTVPPELETENFLYDLKNALKEDGMVVFNKFINSKSSRNRIISLEELYRKVFGNIKVMTIMLTGKIFIAKKLCSTTDK
jgi:spermidine synthase